MYLDKLSTTKDKIENLDENSEANLVDHSELGPVRDANLVRGEDNSQTRIKVDVDGINLEVGYVEEIFP